MLVFLVPLVYGRAAWPKPLIRRARSKALLRGTPVAVKFFRLQPAPESGAHPCGGAGTPADAEIAAESPWPEDGRRTFDGGPRPNNSEGPAAGSRHSAAWSRRGSGSSTGWRGSSASWLGSRRRLRDGMRRLTGIRHPCITAVLGVSKAPPGIGEGSCLVMELMELGR